MPGSRGFASTVGRWEIGEGELRYTVRTVFIKIRSSDATMDERGLQLAANCSCSPEWISYGLDSGTSVASTPLVEIRIMIMPIYNLHYVESTQDMGKYGTTKC